MPSSSAAREIETNTSTRSTAGNPPGKTQTLSIAIHDALQAGQGSHALVLVGIISLLCIAVLLGSGHQDGSLQPLRDETRIHSLAAELAHLCGIA